MTIAPRAQRVAHMLADNEVEKLILSAFCPRESVLAMHFQPEAWGSKGSIVWV
eukprot:m.939730 g.939730  ORF g.939730 m.939730 type:complete len:53 (-) comp23824_c0_seq12:879-1037(-)